MEHRETGTEQDAQEMMEGLALITEPEMIQIEDQLLIARRTIRKVQHLPAKTTVLLVTDAGEEHFVFDPFGVLWAHLRGPSAELWEQLQAGAPGVEEITRCG